MNYGLYLSASGMLTAMHRQDVVANNLSNASTVGFKRDLSGFYHRQAAAREDMDMEAGKAMLDRLGAGAMVMPTRTDLSQGPLTHTSDPFHLAIDGEGFFPVSVNDGRSESPSLTRDGRFGVDKDGYLVTMTGGHRVLDASDLPIRIDMKVGGFEVDESGRITQNSVATGQRIQLRNLPPSMEPRHIGHGLFEVTAFTAQNWSSAGGRILQNKVEESNVDPVRSTLEMIEATRSITSNATMLRHHDLLMDRAANVLGRVA